MKAILLALLLPLALLAQCPNDKYCLACGANSRCTSCIYTFIDATGVCQSPSTTVANCRTYRDSTQCSSCELGYYLVNNACNAIKTDRCLVVQPQNPDTCLACKHSNVVVNGVCKKDTKCYDYNCKVCNGSTNCIECKKYFSIDANGSCVPDPTDGCGRVGANVKECVQCQQGYYSAGSYCRITNNQKSSASLYTIGLMTSLVAYLML